MRGQEQLREQSYNSVGPTNSQSASYRYLKHSLRIPIGVDSARDALQQALPGSTACSLMAACWLPCSSRAFVGLCSTPTAVHCRSMHQARSYTDPSGTANNLRPTSPADHCVLIESLPALLTPRWGRVRHSLPRPLAPKLLLTSL